MVKGYVSFFLKTVLKNYKTFFSLFSHINLQMQPTGLGAKISRYPNPDNAWFKNVRIS